VLTVLNQMNPSGIRLLNNQTSIHCLDCRLSPKYSSLSGNILSYSATLLSLTTKTVLHSYIIQFSKIYENFSYTQLQIPSGKWSLVLNVSNTGPYEDDNFAEVFSLQFHVYAVKSNTMAMDSSEISKPFVLDTLLGYSNTKSVPFVDDLNYALRMDWDCPGFDLTNFNGTNYNGILVIVTANTTRVTNAYELQISSNATKFNNQLYTSLPVTNAENLDYLNNFIVNSNLASIDSVATVPLLGINNIFVGLQAGSNLVHGTGNVGIGLNAGKNYLSTESNNICIAATGTTSESGVITLGNTGHTGFYCPAITNNKVVPYKGIGISSSGRIGTRINAFFGLAGNDGTGEYTFYGQQYTSGSFLTADSSNSLTPYYWNAISANYADTCPAGIYRITISGFILPATNISLNTLGSSYNIGRMGSGSITAVYKDPFYQVSEASAINATEFYPANLNKSFLVNTYPSYYNSVTTEGQQGPYSNTLTTSLILNGGYVTTTFLGVTLRSSSLVGSTDANKPITTLTFTTPQSSIPYMQTGMIALFWGFNGIVYFAPIDSCTTTYLRFRNNSVNPKLISLTNVYAFPIAFTKCNLLCHLEQIG